MTQLHAVENRFTSPLDERGIVLQRGWNADVAAAAVKGAQDPRIGTKTGDPQRFANVEVANEWAANTEKHPIVYSLANQAIGGLIWFSEAHRHGADYTFAIRMYEPLVGKGLAGAFLEATHEDFAEQTGYNGPIWLSTDINNNDIALHLYQTHGYQAIPGAGSDHEYEMLRKQTR